MDSQNKEFAEYCERAESVFRAHTPSLSMLQIAYLIGLGLFVVNRDLEQRIQDLKHEIEDLKS